MSAVTNEPQTHHRAAARVADRSGEPGATGGNHGSAKPTPGIANAPIKPLPDIKPDPKRASALEIETGIHLLRWGRTLEGQNQLGNGIDAVVARLAGEKNLDDWAKVKAATDEILTTYARRTDLNPRDKAAVVNGVNDYLRLKVVDGLVHATNEAQLNRAKKVAVSYVTNLQPRGMNQKNRLIYLTGQMLIAGVNQKIVDDVIAQCKPSEIK